MSSSISWALKGWVDELGMRAACAAAGFIHASLTAVALESCIVMFILVLLGTTLTLTFHPWTKRLSDLCLFVLLASLLVLSPALTPFTVFNFEPYEAKHFNFDNQTSYPTFPPLLLENEVTVCESGY